MRLPSRSLSLRDGFMYLFKRKNPLERWVKQYLEHRATVYPSAADAHAHWLALFLEVARCEIVDLSDADIGRFIRFVDERYATRHHRIQALTAVGCFMRYQSSLGHKYLGSLSVLIRRRKQALTRDC